MQKKIEIICDIKVVSVSSIKTHDFNSNDDTLVYSLFFSGRTICSGKYFEPKNLHSSTNRIRATIHLLSSAHSSGWLVEKRVNWHYSERLQRLPIGSVVNRREIQNAARHARVQTRSDNLTTRIPIWSLPVFPESFFPLGPHERNCRWSTEPLPFVALEIPASNLSFLNAWRKNLSQAHVPRTANISGNSKSIFSWQKYNRFESNTSKTFAVWQRKW